jgi:subtilisin family serine protease
VVNLSLGGSQWSEAEQQAIAIVQATGKVVVASAGNTGDRIPQYPAAFPGVISVGATDDGGQVAGFSSYGKVDVVAPGDCVAVAEIPGVDQDRGCPGDDRDGVAFNSGTSFSAPIVSGVLALAESRGSLLARLTLEATADGDPRTGWPTPTPSSTPTTRPPRRPWSWRRAATTAASTASGRATASCPTRTPPTSPTPSRPTRGWTTPRARPASPAPPLARPSSTPSTATPAPSGPPSPPAT